MRNALAVRATIAIRRIPAAGSSIAVEWTTENRERSPRGIAVKRKELLVEGHELRRGLIGRSGYGINATARQLLKNIVLKCRRWNCRGTDDRQGNPNPFGIEEEKQLVVDDRASETSSEVIHRQARLVVSSRGVRKEIGRTEFRAV